MTLPVARWKSRIRAGRPLEVRALSLVRTAYLRSVTRRILAEKWVGLNRRNYNDQFTDRGTHVGIHEGLEEFAEERILG